VRNKEVDITSRYKSLNKNNIIGDFKFIIIEKIVSYENDFKVYEKVILNIYSVLRFASLSREKEFGIDASSVVIETVPLVVSDPRQLNLKRIE
jgi:KUP system potassium uptake protein